MNSEWFEKVIKQQIKTCEDVLIGKAKEYATDDDRLHNFKNAAGMMSCDPKEALAGMMAKHTISVYDMCRSGKDYSIELWNEKITDHINYLLLLKAIVEEEKTFGKYKSIIGNSASKSKDDTPKIEEDPEALDEAIESFRRTLVCCGEAECGSCHHYNLLQIGEKCSTGLLSEFDNIIIRLKEEHNDHT